MSKTVKKLLASMAFLDCGKGKLVMDRGFYSEENINALYKQHLKFLMSVRMSVSFVKTELEKIRKDIRTWKCYSEEYDLYTRSTTTTWDYKQKRPYKKDCINEDRRMYLHFYYSAERATEDEKRHNILLSKLRAEIESGQRKVEHEKMYTQYFETHTTPVRGIKVTAKQDAIDEARKNYGFFALISNDIKDSIEALRTYRNKDLAEKAFGNLKERLNLRRTLVSSDASLDGKLFVEFVALIYLSFIKKKMQDVGLFKKFTLQGLLDELDVIECFEQKGHQAQCGEMTKKQIELYGLLGIDPPSLQ